MQGVDAFKKAETDEVKTLKLPSSDRNVAHSPHHAHAMCPMLRG